MKVVVLKIGGSVQEQLPASFYKKIIELHESNRWMPVIVHGGGPLISSLLTSLKMETKFVNGLRVTSQQVLDIVEMVLSGSANKQLVRYLIEAGGKAIGLSGIDGLLLKAEPIEGAEELGFVGKVVEVNTSVIVEVMKQGYIPVISPVGMDEKGQRYNINGDMAASAIANALGVNLCLISDIPGIYLDDNNQRIVLEEITKLEVEAMIEDGQIKGGMIPKVKAAIDGLAHHIPEVSIINGLEESSLYQYCNGEKTGTKIVLHKEELYVK
ncbi:acetylglutamate kinase [Bacillus sp. CGMCC 1.16607]|uniref:acetylglutamate kinase n=1 Tax=Bacillus sp. CGMCC 1.16607 TaxID=3351842 RepID=UPI0036287BC7